MDNLEFEAYKKRHPQLEEVLSSPLLRGVSVKDIGKIYQITATYNVLENFREELFEEHSVFLWNHKEKPIHRFFAVFKPIWKKPFVMEVPIATTLDVSFEGEDPLWVLQKMSRSKSRLWQIIEVIVVLAEERRIKIPVIYLWMIPSTL